MDLVIISTSADWWERLSPLKQRAHISRHPKGKVAKKVVSGKLKLKPVRKHGDPVPLGEEVDTPSEERKLQRYAQFDLDALKEANGEETQEGSAQKQNAAPDPTKGVENKLPQRHALISKIVSKASPDIKAGVRGFYDNLPNIKASPPSPAEISRIVQSNPDDDHAIVDSFNSDHPEELRKTLKAVKPVAKSYVKAAGVAGLLGLAAVAVSVIPAIFAVAYLAHKLNDHIEAKQEESKKKEEDGGGEDLNKADTKRRNVEFKRLVATKREQLSKEEFKKWKKQMDEWRDLQGLPAVSSALSISHSAQDDGIVTMVNDFDHWFKTIDLNQLMEDHKVASTSAAGLRIILSPTLKYFDEVHHKQYLLVQGNDLIGTVNWDMSMGDPHPDVYGWKATLRDGFPESSFHSGRDPNNKFAPYTVIHRGEVKLHNPTRMNLDTAYSWAKSIYKGMQDAKAADEDEELGSVDSESEL